MIELGKPSQAIPILKNYLTATQNSPDSILGKIWIGQAYLDLRKFNEAFLISIEIDHLILESDPISDPLIQSLLIKAQALIGLDHPGQAIEVLEFAKNHLSNKNSPEIKGQTFLLQLKLKGKDCARLPSKDRLDEGQTRDQMDRRGLCLLEELLIYQKILGTQDPRSSERASAQITGDFDDYAKACSGPFHPPQKDNRANSIHRTANELRRYQAELAGQLKQDCSKKGDSAVELLNSWKTRVPPAMVGSLTQTTQSLEKFTSRIQ